MYKDNIRKVNFFVSEHSEFKYLGECYEDISSLKEAINIYNSLISSDKGIGIVLKETDNPIFEEAEFIIYRRNSIELEIINEVDYLKENKLIKNILEKLKSIT